MYLNFCFVIDDNDSSDAEKSPIVASEAKGGAGEKIILSSIVSFFFLLSYR